MTDMSNKRALEPIPFTTPGGRTPPRPVRVSTDTLIPPAAGTLPAVSTDMDLEEFQENSISELYTRALLMHKQHQLDDLALSKIETALQDIITTLDEHNPGRYIVRQARLSDIDSLEHMVAYWAQQGENLPRPREDLVRNILSFAVCVKDNVVCGCASLYVYDSGLAEIRSLGVSPHIQRQGQGTAIVNFLVNRARRMHIRKVFVLTRNVNFFAKVGFSRTDVELLPEKIRKDCDNCPKKDCCDETAYELNLGPQADS